MCLNIDQLWNENEKILIARMFQAQDGIIIQEKVLAHDSNQVHLTIATRKINTFKRELESILGTAIALHNRNAIQDGVLAIVQSVCKDNGIGPEDIQARLKESETFALLGQR